MSHARPTVPRMPDPGERRMYATWRNPDGLIRPVGVLTRFSMGDGELYRFVYLKAAEGFEEFECLPGLPDVHRVYEADYLFPVFRNRLMARRRPDYEDYVGRLGLDGDADPFEVLMRSEGRRATDRIEVFAHPERTADGMLVTRFFARGIRHLPGAAEAVDELQPGDVLEFKDQPENRVNRRAVLISTRTGREVGWMPDCLVDMLHELRDLGTPVEVAAEHVNPATSPSHMRLLCRLRAPWPDGYEPLTGPEYHPIAA